MPDAVTYRATGKRKTSVARVTLTPGVGTVVVNDRMHSFEAPNEDVKRQWVAKLQSFVDKYRLSEAPNRQIRRLMEKENKKLREVLRREFVETVRVRTPAPHACVYPGPC